MPRQSAAPASGIPGAGPPIRLQYVVRDLRVREIEVLAEFPHSSGAVVPNVDCSVVIGTMIWRVAHVRHDLEARRIEVWLVAPRARSGREPI